METVIGLQGRDFIVLVADMSSARSILCYNHDVDKIFQLDSHQLLACAGDHSSRAEFSDYIEKNIALIKLRTNRSLSNNAAANFIRSEIANALRSRGAYQVNCLFGSFDEKEGPALYWMDYLGTMTKVPFGAHGYGATFAIAQLDASFSEDMSAADAVSLVKQCCDQLARRYLINQPVFNIKILTDKSIDQEFYHPQFKQDS